MRRWWRVLGFGVVAVLLAIFVQAVPWDHARYGGAPSRMGLPSPRAIFSAIPFRVHHVKDPNLPRGRQLVIKPGMDGARVTIGGKSLEILRPTPAIVGQGTDPVRELRVHGVTYRYDRVKNMMTTAYDASMAKNGRTGAVAVWDGKRLKPGDVAVDPRVVPLGTYLYIEGYGPARAVDTGTAVSGDQVELFFNESPSQIATYGFQFHKVYILTARPPHFSA